MTAFLNIRIKMQPMLVKVSLILVSLFCDILWVHIFSGFVWPYLTPSHYKQHVGVYRTAVNTERFGRLFHWKSLHQELTWIWTPVIPEVKAGELPWILGQLVLLGEILSHKTKTNRNIKKRKERGKEVRKEGRKKGMNKGRKEGRRRKRKAKERKEKKRRGWEQEMLESWAFII